MNLRERGLALRKLVASFNNPSDKPIDQILLLLAFYALLFSVLTPLHRAAFASVSPSLHTFTYQGQLTNAAGTAPLLDTVSIEVGIYSPDGGCLLYDEFVSGIDLTLTNGLFAIEIGSELGDPKRTALDPSLSMLQVFANTGAAIRPAGSADCLSGYTPATEDGRTLQFTITPSSTGVATTLIPNQILVSVPYAQVAETLQGMTPSNFLQPDLADNLSQLTLVNLTNGSDASTLHNHDSSYLKSGSGVAQNAGAGGLYTAGGVGIGTGTTTTNVQLQVDSTSAANRGVVIQAAAGQTANLFEVDNSSGVALTWIDNSGKLHGDGSSLTNLPAGISGLTAGGITYSTSATTIATDSSNFFWDSTNHLLGIGNATPAAGLDLRRTLTSSSGTDYAMKISPTINASGTEGYTALFVNTTESTVGSGTKLLADLQLGGVSRFKVDNAGRLIAASSVQFGADAAACGGSNTGAIRLNGINLQFCNGTAWTVLGAVGAAVTSLNGLSTSTQSFANDNAGTSPAFNSSGSTHTLSIPLASTATVTQGLLGNTDYGNFVSAYTATNAATNANTASTLVRRDASGNFSSGAITLAGSGANALSLTGAPAASTTSSLESLGSAISAGSANGTYLGMNSASGFTGDFANFQLNAASKFKVSYLGDITFAGTLTGNGSGLTNLLSTSVPWASPGTIGSTAPNTGAFTTLTASGAATFSSTISDGGTPSASSTSSLLGLGSAVSGGNVNGTYLSINSASAFTGDYANFELNGSSKFKVDYLGGITFAGTLTGNGSGLTNIPSSAINWAAPGTIGSTTPNTAAFTSLTSSGAATFTGNTASTNTTTGTLVVTGGEGISGNLNVGGTVGLGGATAITDATNSSSATTGALVVSGGVGISKNLNVSGATAGNTLVLAGTLTVAGSTSLGTTPATTTNLPLLGQGGGFTGGNANGTYYGINAASAYNGDFINFKINNVSKFNIGGTGNVTFAGTLTGNGSGLTNLPSSSVPWATPGTIGSTTPSTGAFTTLTASDITTIASTTASTTSTTGALIVSGGEGLAGNLNVGGKIGVGIAASTPAVYTAGQIVSAQTVIASGATVDFNNGNVQILQSVGGPTITLNNMIDGAAYSVIVTDATSQTYTFTNCTNSHFVPTNGPTIASTRTVYSILKTTESSATHCYISWITGFN